jgi:anti-anti-sigma factor
MAEPLTITIDRAPAHAVVVRVHGRIDGRTAPQLLEQATAARQPGRTLVLNLANVTFVSSAGVGVLMVLSETLARDRSTLRIAPASEAVLAVLSLLNLDQHLAIDASEQAALEASGT